MQQEKFSQSNFNGAPLESGANASAVNSSAVYENKQFASIQEELDYLRSVVQSREQHLASHPESEARQQERSAIIDTEIANYSVQDADRVLHEHYKMPAQEQWEIILDLSPEMHDKRMEGLMQVMQEKGVLNAIQVARGMNSPHIDADFHRFLVEYLKKGYPSHGLKETLPVAKALKQTLYEVALPESKGDAEEKRKNLKELISSMEQFYAGMLSISGKPSYGTELVENQFTIELAVANGGAYDYIPTRLKFPSGGMMAFSVDDTDTIKPPVKAIIAVSQKARAFWPAKDTAGQPPLCSSPDGLMGHFDATSEQVKDAATMAFRHPALDTLDPEQAAGPWQCAGCPMAEWGSGKGRGRACKDLRRLIVLVEGWTMPAIMTLPPTSIKAFDTYASACARTRGGAYFTNWTTITLKQDTNPAGIKFSTAQFAVAAPLAQAELAAVIDVRHQYAELVRSLNIVADDYATDGTDAAARSYVQEEATDPF
jgi:hypothetical protein